MLSELLGIFIEAPWLTVNVPVLTVRDGAVILPANVWAVVADKLALSLNVVAKGTLFMWLPVLLNFLLF